MKKFLCLLFSLGFVFSFASCKKEDVKVDMLVRPSYRKMFAANGVSTYFWKVVPAEEVEA